MLTPELLRQIQTLRDEPGPEREATVPGLRSLGLLTRNPRALRSGTRSRLATRGRETPRVIKADADFGNTGGGP